jgi:hypothetical protein
MVESAYSARLWPAHVKPQEDELLSSWLLRIAVAHGLKLNLFCAAIWSKGLVMGRDIDRLSDERVINLIAEGTGVTPARVAETTLSAYEGWLFEKQNHQGYTPWIISLRIYCLDRKSFGLQFCPSCLAEDREPFFRRLWRLAFVTLCGKHHTLLLDRCPRCEVAVNAAQNKLSNNAKTIARIMTCCFACGFDLRKCLPGSAQDQILPQAIDYQRKLQTALQQGWIEVREGEPVYSHLYFRVLLQIIRLLAKREKLREAVSRESRIKMFTPVFADNNREIERLSIPHRLALLGMARFLLSDWSEKFISFSQQERIPSGGWLLRFKDAPYWFWNPIREHLFRQERNLSEQEIRSAINYINKAGGTPYKTAISQLLGVKNAFKLRRSTELLEMVAPNQNGWIRHRKSYIPPI